MINKWVGIGRLTADPILKYTPSGTAVTSFTLAVGRTFKKDETDFIPVVVWKTAAENVANYTHKGSLVGVDGRIQTRSYDNNEGRKVYVTEVVAESVQFLEKKDKPNNGGPNAPTSDTSISNDPFDGTPVDIDLEGELPF